MRAFVGETVGMKSGRLTVEEQARTILRIITLLNHEQKQNLIDAMTESLSDRCQLPDLSDQESPGAVCRIA